jgi:hypothetical protein
MNRIEIDLEKIEGTDIDEVLDKIQSFKDQQALLGESEEEIFTVMPESKIDARKWLLAYQKLDKDIDYLKDEYIKYLTDKYIAPVRAKIEKHVEQQDFIKNSLLAFLESIEEKNICFPDLGTVYQSKTPIKLLYPEDDEAILERLAKEKPEFVRTTLAFDKKKVMEVYKETEELPFDGITVIESMQTVRIKDAKKD